MDAEQKVKSAVRSRHSAQLVYLLQRIEHNIAHFSNRLQFAATKSGARFERSGGGKLRDYRRTNEDGVLNFLHRHEKVLRHHHVAHAPTGKAVCLGKGEKGDGVAFRSSDGAR